MNDNEFENLVAVQASGAMETAMPAEWRPFLAAMNQEAALLKGGTLKEGEPLGSIRRLQDNELHQLVNASDGVSALLGVLQTIYTRVDQRERLISSETQDQQVLQEKRNLLLLQDVIVARGIRVAPNDMDWFDARMNLRERLRKLTKKMDLLDEHLLIKKGWQFYTQENREMAKAPPVEITNHASGSFQPIQYRWTQPQVPVEAHATLTALSTAQIASSSHQHASQPSGSGRDLPGPDINSPAPLQANVDTLPQAENVVSHPVVANQSQIASAHAETPHETDDPLKQQRIRYVKLIAAEAKVLQEAKENLNSVEVTAKLASFRIARAEILTNVVSNGDPQPFLHAVINVFEHMEKPEAGLKNNLCIQHAQEIVLTMLARRNPIGFHDPNIFNKRQALLARQEELIGAMEPGSDRQATVAHITNIRQRLYSVGESAQATAPLPQNPIQLTNELRELIIQEADRVRFLSTHDSPGTADKNLDDLKEKRAVIFGNLATHGINPLGVVQTLTNEFRQNENIARQRGVIEEILRYQLAQESSLYLQQSRETPHLFDDMNSSSLQLELRKRQTEMIREIESPGLRMSTHDLVTNARLIYGAQLAHQLTSDTVPRHGDSMAGGSNSQSVSAGNAARSNVASANPGELSRFDGQGGGKRQNGSDIPAPIPKRGRGP